MKELRTRHRLTQEQLAEQAGLPYRVIVDLERGKAAVELDILEALGHVFGLRPLLASILPRGELSDTLLERLLQEGITRASLGMKLRDFDQPRLQSFVYVASQLPAAEVETLYQWMKSRLNDVWPDAARLGDLIAKATSPERRRQRQREAERIEKELEG